MAFKNPVTVVPKLATADAGGRIVITPGPASNGYGQAHIALYTGNASEQAPAELVAIADGPNPADNISVMILSPEKATDYARSYIQMFSADSNNNATLSIGGDVVRLDSQPSYDGDGHFEVDRSTFLNGPVSIQGDPVMPTNATEYDTGWLTDAVTPAAGITLSYQRVRRIGNIVNMYLSFAGASLSVPISGNCGNVTVGTITSALVPSITQGGLGVGTAGRGAWGIIDNTGAIQIVATVPNATQTGTTTQTDVSGLAGAYFLG